MNNKTTPKDFFLHLGATIALYASAAAFMNLCFSIVNYSLPDALAGNYYSSTIAWPISMVIVLVPLLYVLEWLIRRDIALVPEKREVWVRRWRIWLTLFITGATVIGDLISLINTYVSGEITSRFVYKVIIVLVVSGAVFAYYLLDKPVASQKTAVAKKALGWVGVVIVLAGTIAAFAVVGSPGHQRDVRLDQQRTSDLSSIQYRILDYWQTKGRVPNQLSDLKDGISYINLPIDPVTKGAYEYSTSDKNSFELCANFATAFEDNAGRGSSEGDMMSYRSSMMINDSYYYGGDIGIWKHPAGKFCFQRTIDPDKYPRKTPQPAPLRQ